MCTVSYITHGNKRIITSNRDEHVSRPAAFHPKEEYVNGFKITYPRDPKGKGTWFALRGDGVGIVLLNGAFKKHTPKQNYALSRGLIVLQIISDKEPENQLSKIDLLEIEPFTLVFFDGKQLLEFRWDGTTKHKKQLNPDENYIWSSTTLYDEIAKVQREKLFNKFLEETSSLTENAVIDFHLGNNDDFENGFIIKRQSGLQTVSITQAQIGKGAIDMTYFDLRNTKNDSHISYLQN